MIAWVEPYSAMRDSDVPWLGSVPAHWELLPALAVYKPRSEKNIGMIERTVLSLSYGRIIVKPEEKLRGLVPESFETYQIVERGNIIVRPTDLQNDRKSLRIGHAKDRGIITSAYMCLQTTDKVENEFGYQYLNAYDLLKIIYGYGSGLRQNLDFKDIKRMPVLVPPKSEQAAIVRFIDHADRRIRRAIRAKQALIKLLGEQKQAIIHHAVTRGLDPAVRLKPSGVEWLGDVPEHWNVLALKRVCTLLKDGTHLPPPRQAEGYPLLSVRNIVSGNFVCRTDDSFISESHFNDLCRSFVPRHQDVLLAIVGATIGKVAIVPDMGKFHIQRSLAVFRAKPEVLSYRFLAAFLRGPAFQRALWMTVAFSAQPGIYLNTLRGFSVVLPPIEEQGAIADALDAQLVELDRTMAAAHREIALLLEYRTRLIADVVTGKLDVREAAARLPDAVDPADAALNDAALVDEGDEDAADAGLESEDEAVAA